MTVSVEFQRNSKHKTQCALQGEREEKDKNVKDGKFKLRKKEKQES